MNGSVQFIIHVEYIALKLNVTCINWYIIPIVNRDFVCRFFFRRSDMLTEDNDPTKPAGVLDNAGNVSSSTEASVQHPRAANNGK